MTLAISYVNPNFALHVSDRLVADSSTGDPLDPAANKVALLMARDGILCLSHAGLAAVGTGPDMRSTDHWIAEQLAGRSLEVCRVAT